MYDKKAEFIQIDCYKRLREINAFVIKLPYNTVWKNEKFTPTEKISRQINYLVTLLVHPLVSRNICQKSMGVHFRNFHTIAIVSYFHESFFM